ncbi:uncharacterized protein PV09_05351 [Verruconis gallopava]|uniref:2EXR domain-containing protein n=1 Tax=Verruconis gallopava TaxID=253628 RepID=A0A0D2AA31_9PEZI|nr:uncharacterized protein PV09_05351 [Verruconis gallopava]KIW03598.1 hypothetical protein PV09_05351 [Verruconis gallopava]
MTTLTITSQVTAGTSPLPTAEVKVSFEWIIHALASMDAVSAQPSSRQQSQPIEVTAGIASLKQGVISQDRRESSVNPKPLGGDLNPRQMRRTVVIRACQRDTSQKYFLARLHCKRNLEQIGGECPPRAKRPCTKATVLSCADATESEAITSAAEEAPTKCRLLRLPAEIRNMIWRFAVVSPEQLNIVGDSPQQPALARTCRQIRNECLRFFYRENSFACTIYNYDPVNFKRYRKVGDKYGLSTVLLTHRHDPNASREFLRSNLLSWLEGTVRGDTAPLGYSAGHSEESFTWDKLSHRIVKVFNIARNLRAANVDLAISKDILSNALDAAGICGEKR